MATTGDIDLVAAALQTIPEQHGPVHRRRDALDDPVVVGRRRAVALAVLRSLGGRPMVFHLELFSDDSAGRTIFLEIGARVGGAEVPYLWREVHAVATCRDKLRARQALASAGIPPAERLGGDIIPMLGQIATGADLMAVAVDLAFGRLPHVSSDRGRCAEVAFACPPEDCVVISVDTAAAAAAPGIVLAVPLAAPDAVLRLPPRGVVPRLAAVIAETPTAGDAATVIAEAMSLIDARYEPLPDAVEPLSTAPARS